MDDFFDRLHNAQFELISEFDRVCRKYDIRYTMAYGTLLGAVRHKDFIPWDDDMDVYLSYGQIKKLIAHKDAFSEGFRLIIPEDYGDRYCDFVPRLVYLDSRVRPADDPRQNYYLGLRNHLQVDIFCLSPMPEGIPGKAHCAYLMFLYSMANAFRWPGERLRENYSFTEKLISLITQPAGSLLGIDRIRRLLRKEHERLSGIRSDKAVVTNNARKYFSQAFPRSAFGKRSEIPMHGKMFFAPADPDPVLSVLYGDYMKLPPEEERTSCSVDPEAFWVHMKDTEDLQDGK
ncbi:MAG: LicD family protein [Lachnospiraceae bacterium]|nr:LicD family protein [Lachnospiraceae bacterium]